MKKYAVLTREPRCFLGSFDFSWEQRKLSDLAEKTYGGGTPSTSNEAYWNGDIPWIQSSDVVDGRLLGVEPRKWITQDGLNNSAAQLIPGNSIAIITRVGVGKLAFMPYSYTTSQDFLSLSKLNAEPLFTVYACYKKLQTELNAVQGTSIKGITKDELLAKNIMVPRYAEQQQIGAFFKQLDHLITLHQRKCALLFSSFQALIAMMFTTSTFSWEQRKFSDVVATRRGLTYKPSDIRKNGVRVLRSSNIAEDSFVLSDEDVFVVREAVNIDCVRANDILITAANGSSRLVGKHTIISGIPEESAVHGGFMLLGTTKEPHFVNASMGSSWYRRFIELFVAGGNGAIGNLNKNDLDNQDIAIPSEKEQKKIGSFFRQLDDLITLHQRKVEKLTNVKKSMLEKMFPQNGSCYPAVRFKEFTDPWEQWKVSDVITDIARPIELMDNQRYQMVTVKRRNEGVVSRGFMYGRDILVKNYYEVHTDDYLISKRQLVHGANGLVPESLNNAVVSNEYMVCIGNEFVSAGFLALLSKTKSLKRDFFLSSYGVDIEKLVFDVDDWKKRLIVLPTIDEQNKICAYFRCLDNLITLHQRELEQLQSIKKSLLEKMFV